MGGGSAHFYWYAALTVGGVSSMQALASRQLASWTVMQVCDPYHSAGVPEVASWVSLDVLGEGETVTP